MTVTFVNDWDLYTHLLVVTFTTGFVSSTLIMGVKCLLIVFHVSNFRIPMIHTLLEVKSGALSQVYTVVR